MRAALEAATAVELPVTLLGGGSNVLVADRGVPGLVVRTRGGRARPIRPGIVRAEAGMTLNGLIRWTIHRGLSGLEAWAGTPGTVGGAIRGNAHFGGREIGEQVEAVRIFEDGGKVTTVPGLPRSSRPVVLSADFRVGQGAPEALRRRARRSLAFRKRTQPLARPSAGCAFRNPDPAAPPLPAGVPRAAGALLDRAGLKGRSVGGARVSGVHANFFVTGAGATAADVRRLMEMCREIVRNRFGVRLEPEIVFLGDFAR